MSTSHCAQTACGHGHQEEQQHCNVHCKNRIKSSLCDNVYDPRQENQKVCGDDHKTGSVEKFDAPVGIYEVNSTKIDLPPLCWSGYETTPKSLTMRNTGRTVMISGRWGRGRPYLTGGPLNGSYIFSQIHFHCPSEHQINGIRYPLEMHVVHYKTTYLTQERAMYEKDGTIVLVYLFQVADSTPTQLNHICKVIPCLDAVNSSIELPKQSLDHIISPFASNYYLYSGSVNTEKNSYLLQWFIHRKIACVSRGEVNNLLKIMDTFKMPCTRMKPENGEVFIVEDEDLGSRSKSKTHIKRSDECKKSSSVQTCKSLSSLKSLCLRASNSCYEKLLLKEDSSSPRKQVKISRADGCTNTTPKTSKNEITKSKKSVKVSEKESDSNASCPAKESKKKGGAHSHKEEKSSKAKKDLNAKEKKSKKEERACEKAAKAICQSSSSCKSFLNEELHQSNSVSNAVCDAVDDIKTIYEKKQKGKKKSEKKDSSKHRKDGEKCDDVQVNFLLTPNAIRSNYSNAIDSVGSKTFDTKDGDEEEDETVLSNEKVSKNCLSIPTQILVKRTSLSDTALPTTNAENESKEFCLMMEHLFRSDNNSNKNKDKENDKDKSWNFQEYHVAIEYDHNILQEYNGMVQPDQLSEGNYEKLNLVPKYEDSKNLHIALTDCSVKLENAEDIRIRAKFLLKENALINSLSPEKREAAYLQNHLDAGTQCATHEIEPVNPFRPESILSSESDMEEYIKSQITKLIEDRKSSLKINNLREELKEELHSELRNELRNKLQQELRNEFLQREDQICDSTSSNMAETSSLKKKIQRLGEPREKPVESLSLADPIEVLPAAKIIESPKVELLDIKKSKTKTDFLTENKTKEFIKADLALKSDRDSSKRIKIGKKNSLKSSEGSSIGNFSCSSSTSINSNTKTTYFVYDRIEKDANTGKKIFVGSFKTKEEMKILRKCSSSRDLVELTSDLYSSEQPTIHENRNSHDVAIHDIFSQDSDLVRIDTWCNEQLSDNRSQRTQIISHATPAFNHIENFTLHKCHTENFDQPKNQLKGKEKKVLIGNIRSQANKSSEKQTSEPSSTNSVINSKQEPSKRSKTEKSLTSNSTVPTNSAATSMTTSTTLSDLKRSSKKIKSTVDKSVTNIENKATSFEKEDFVRRNERQEPAVRSVPSRNRISTRSGRAKGTVIVIPIEVESLSKIELILVEHADDRTDKTDNEYIPCLNCYKCLELPLSIYHQKVCMGRRKKRYRIFKVHPGGKPTFYSVSFFLRYSTHIKWLF